MTGDYIINDSCDAIQCGGMCQQIAPNNFAINLNKAVVTVQPETETDKTRCGAAKQSCPVHAIAIEQPPEPEQQPEPTPEPPPE